MKKVNRFKRISLSISLAWLCLFFIFPLGLVMGMSLLHFDAKYLVRLPVTISNYQAVLNPVYLKIIFKSFFMAGTCTFLCLLIAYPFAYFVAKGNPNLKPLWMLLLIIPFWTSSLIRTYAMMAILKSHGVFNQLLIKTGVINQPLEILYSNVSVVIGLVYNLLPFMIFPLIVNLERLDDHLIEAAKDLGSSKFQLVKKIILPLSKPGIVAGCIMVFLPAMTLFYIPELLGGAKSMLLGNLIQNQFLYTRNWPLGSSLSMTLTLIMLSLTYFYWRSTTRKNRGEFL